MQSGSRLQSRLQSVDALRGLIMIIMALDHVRDFFHHDAGLFSPTDLTRTTTLLFLTRWITLFCAPTFMFTAGIGAFFWWQRGRTKPELSKYLFTRGLWLIVLELTAMRLALNFNFSLQYPLFLITLFALGGSMIALAALIWLPIRALSVLSVAVILLHNTLDGVRIAHPLWNLLHQPGAFQIGGMVIIFGYPLISWIATMAAGFCFGEVLQLPPEHRRTILLRTGLAASLGFIALRFANVYGDPSKWNGSALSFLNLTKNPPSLLFLLMTLGPVLLVLWVFDRLRFSERSPLLVFGRVPLFFFLAHFYLIHAISGLLAIFRYGAAGTSMFFSPPPAAGALPGLFPADYGYSLGITYLAWILIVATMYPLCRWYGDLKAARRYWWLSYL
jgi:uncharacterized membrane protein